jgi:hypothetical protein
MTKELKVLTSNADINSNDTGTCEACKYLEVYRDCCDEFESWCKRFEFRLPADENFGCLHYEVKSND